MTNNLQQKNEVQVFNEAFLSDLKKLWVLCVKLSTVDKVHNTVVDRSIVNL